MQNKQNAYTDLETAKVNCKGQTRPYGSTRYVDPNNWNQNTSRLRSMETTKEAISQRRKPSNIG
jgi:hypothetical protein